MRALSLYLSLTFAKKANEQGKAKQQQPINSWVEHSSNMVKLSSFKMDIKFGGHSLILKVSSWPFAISIATSNWNILRVR